MGFGAILVIAAAVFAVCYLLDKLFTKCFRGTAQHKSGDSVRVNKRYGSIGLIVAVLGVAAILTALPNHWFFLAGGCLLVLVGCGLIVYYMTFGVYYDDAGFLLTTFGKKSKFYEYRDITGQQLFSSYQNLVIELLLSDGRSVQLQASMIGTYSFLDKASRKWMDQTGRVVEDCDFYDPTNSCWFPTSEG